MDGYRTTVSTRLLKAKENGKSGGDGERIVPKLSFPLKINPRGLQIAGRLDVRPIASRANPADAIADTLSPVLTADGGQRCRTSASEGDDGGANERGRKKRLLALRLMPSATDEDGGREDGERPSRGSRPVAWQEPFPIDVIDTLFYPFFHLASRPAVGLRITTRRDRSRAMCCNALGIDGGRLPLKSTLSAVLPLVSIRNVLREHF